jgi:hypothetical protein
VGRGGWLGWLGTEGTGGLEPGKLNLEVILEDNPPKLPMLFLLLRVGRGGGSAIASFGRRGGNEGNSVSPQAGALMRLFPLEFTEVVDAPRPAVVAVDVVEYDASEVTESNEGLRFWSVGLRSGRAGRAGVGGGSRSAFRVGTGGGGFFFGFTSGLRVSIEGAGRTDLWVLSSAGSFPMWVRSTTEPTASYEGGMLADALLSGVGRRNGSGPGGRASCDWFRAAIRC